MKMDLDPWAGHVLGVESCPNQDNANYEIYVINAGITGFDHKYYFPIKVTCEMVFYFILLSCGME